jgi:hypothetical protein
MFKFLQDRNKHFTDLELLEGSKGSTTGARKGLILEGLRNRKTDLTLKILPELFHSICNEYRALNDLEAMMTFINEYGPKMELILTPPGPPAPGKKKGKRERERLKEEKRQQEEREEKEREEKEREEKERGEEERGEEATLN